MRHDCLAVKQALIDEQLGNKYQKKDDFVDYTHEIYNLLDRHRLYQDLA